MKFIENVNKEQYEKFIKSNKKSHFLQSYAWGEFAKAKKHLTPHYVGLVDDNNQLVATALLLEKKIPFGYTYFYSPRGFILDYSNREILNEFTSYIKTYTKKKKSIFIKIDPDIQLQKLDINGNKTYGEDNFDLVEYLKSIGFKHLGYNKKFENNQPRYTFRLELKQDLELITKNFHSTTRKIISKGNPYNLEILKNDISYIDDFYKTMEETAKRENIVQYSKDYYKNFYKILHNNDNSDIYIIYANIEEIKHIQKEKYNLMVNEYNNLTSENKKQEIKNQINKIEKILKELENIKVNKLPLASIITVKYANKVWTVHGGNHSNLRNLNANYLIYYEIIKDAIKQNYEIIDFFGTSYNPNENDPEYGIFLFKKRLGGEYTEFIGEFDYILNKPLYIVFTKLVPIYRNIIKKRAKNSNRR